METATLVTEVRDGRGRGIRRLAVACDHGVSEFIYLTDALPWPLRLSDWDAERMVVAHHFAVERCDCTSTLRMRYALSTGVPTTTNTT
ncbi:MAG: hypothetical protein AB7N70_03970 [Dehalococcoidia bacterium]